MNILFSFLSSPWFNGVSIVISLGTAYYFYWISKKTKVPKYCLRSQRVLTDSISSLGPLEIHYDQKRIANLTATEFYFWNHGKETIRQEDIASSDPLQLKIKSPFTILDTKLLKTSSPSNNIIVSLSEDKTIITLNFEYLDYEQGGIVQILHTGEDSVDLIFSGTIKGFGTPLQVVNKKDRSITFIGSQLTVTALFLGFLILADNAIAAQLGQLISDFQKSLEIELTKLQLMSTTLDSISSDPKQLSHDFHKLSQGILEYVKMQNISLKHLNTAHAQFSSAQQQLKTNTTIAAVIFFIFSLSSTLLLIYSKKSIFPKSLHLSKNDKSASEKTPQ